jgi:hypothetical protein
VNVADLKLPEAKIKRLDHIYRMVGKRDAGLDFKPENVPVFLMTPLIGDYVEWLKESGAAKADIDAANDLFNEFLEVA